MKNQKDSIQNDKKRNPVCKIYYGILHMLPVFYYNIEVLETVTGKEWIKCPGDEKNMQMNQKIYGNCF